MIYKNLFPADEFNTYFEGWVGGGVVISNHKKIHIFILLYSLITAFATDNKNNINRRKFIDYFRLIYNGPGQSTKWAVYCLR